MIKIEGLGGGKISSLHLDPRYYSKYFLKFRIRNTKVHKIFMDKVAMVYDEHQLVILNLFNI